MAIHRQVLGRDPLQPRAAGEGLTYSWRARRQTLLTRDTAAVRRPMPPWIANDACQR